MPDTLVTITGPSCAGKTTFASKMVQMYDNMELVPTFTTRPLRDDDKQYIHLTEEEFKEAEEKGEFAETNLYEGYFYGTKFDSLKSVWNKKKIALKVMEPVGVMALEELQQPFGFRIVKVWIGAPKEVLEKRLQETQRDRNINSDLAWYKMLRWNLVVKNLVKPEKTAQDLNRLIPTFVKYNKMRVWQ
jgi:guanylate kinase